MPSSPIRGRYPIPSPDGYTPAEVDYPNTFTQANTFSDDVTITGTTITTGGINSIKLNETKGLSTVATQASTHGLLTLTGATMKVSTLAVDKDTSTVMVSLSTSAIPPSAPPQCPAATIYSSEDNLVSISNAAVAVVTTTRTLASYGIGGGHTFGVYISGVVSSTATAADTAALALINGLWHTGTQTGAYTFTIPVATNGVGVGLLTGGTYKPLKIATVSLNATDPVITLACAGGATLPTWFANGDIVYISGVVSSTSLAADRLILSRINGHYFAIANVAANHFTVSADTLEAGSGVLTGGEVTCGQFSVTGTINDTVNWWIID
jgi:hypothetical protein